ncbi:MAG: ABC transporter permease [Anaerolineae bacterium]
MTTWTNVRPALIVTAGQETVLAPLPDDTGVINVWEITRMALSSLLANKMRSILTMLGVIIGVASVVALMAVGNGASAEITGQVEAIGTNVLTIIPGSLSNRTPGASVAAQTLTLEDANAVAALNLPVTGVAPQMGAPASVVAAAADKNANVVGVTPAYQTVNALALTQGSFLTEDQVRSVAPVVVLGSNLAQDLFGSGEAVGQTVRIKNQTLRVIGVLTPKGGGAFGSVDDRAFVPISVAQQRLFGGRTPDGKSYQVSAITLAAQNSEDLPAIQQRVTALLRDRHQAKADGSADDFSIMNQASFLSTLSTITTLLTVFLAAIAGISLLVGGIGIMNIMLVSVTERTREIGLRLAIGALEREVLLQCLIEAVVLAALGGLIGIVLATGASIGLSALMKVPYIFNPGVNLLSFFFSAGIGVLFGYFPARRAARMDPIDALRHE